MEKRRNLLKNIIIVSVTIISFYSCNNGNQKLKNENLKLLNQVDSLESIIDAKNELDLQEQKRKVDSYNEQFALDTFKEYVSFYCPNCDYKDFKVKKYSNYSFDIAMQKRSNAELVAHGWTGVVIRLTFDDNGKFSIENIQGTHDFGCQ